MATIGDYRTLVVNYNGKQYSLLEHPYLFKSVEEFNISEKVQDLKIISRFEETDEELILSLGMLSCEIDASENISFSENFTNIIRFDKASQKVISGERLSKDNINTWSFCSLHEPKIFLDKICSINDNVFKYLKTYPKYLIDGLAAYGSTGINYNINFFNLCVFNLLEFEKLINSNNVKILESNLQIEGFEISEANKLHQIIGLPKFAVQLMKDMKMEDYMLEIKDLSDTVDGNSLRIFLEFIDNMKLVLKADKNLSNYQKEINMKKFLNDCRFILDKKRNYKVTELLSYLLRQVVFFRDNSTICFPFAEAGYFKDYIEMNENYGLKFERYPAKIKRAHNLTVKNIQALIDSSQEVNDKFEESVMIYADVEKTIKYIKDPKKPEEFVEYSFIVPHNIKALIQEGNDMHHCVGSYVNKIIDKEARVVFMRLTAKKNESLITLDIDEKYNLVEAKKAFNEEVDDEQMKVIKKWLTEIKKLVV